MGTLSKDVVQSAQALFELGKLYCDRGDFKIALDKLSQASDMFFSAKEFSGYLKCMNLSLRMFAEMEDFKSIHLLKEKLQDLVIKEGVELNSKTHYTLALCASYKGQHATALEYMQKSLQLALQSDSKEDMCYAISGLANVNVALEKYDEALKEIYNLQVFFQVMPLPELKMSSILLNGHILRRTGKFQEALDILWQCYEPLKQQKNLYIYVSLLYAVGITYAEMGDSDLARLYLGLAKKSVDPENLRYLARKIDERLTEVGVKPDQQYDLIIEAASNSVVERKKGRVDFKNQFILLDLLRLFVTTPGEIYSKEALVKKIWKQDYDPSVHDNKIYVTIKRLRKMIEPDFDKPKYIFRAKNGYYLNRNTRVYFEH